MTDTQTRITTPFGFESTASQVIDGIDLSGKRALVTGAGSGIGTETARALASAGAAVTIAVRNAEQGERAAEQISASTGNESVGVALLDLADRASIAAFLDAWRGPLHILVNNAGVMALPERELSAEGWEMQFATNHMGHFELTLGLHDALETGAPSRVVSLSSRGHLRSPVVFEDVNFERRDYDPWLAYGQSKTANVLFAVGADQRWRAQGIRANAVHPGAIAETNLGRHMDPELRERLRASGQFRFKTIEQGAATSVLVATSPLLDGVGGRYFEDCNEGELVTDVQADTPSGVAAYAVDPENADRLWELSLGLLD
jgi:NAD(P)-dependent dehydrogenase (short-subunit alcohol dehydrogenase family)